MLTVGIAAILLIPSLVLSSRPTCVSIEDGDDKTSVIASCTFMDLTDIPIELPAETVLSLDVSDNQLKVLHNESFRGYVNLMTLTLSYNEIKHVRLLAFSGLQQLREVDLSYNLLEYIDPEIFSDNPKLETVSLAGNPLVFFPADSPALISSSLTSLDLSSCSLTSVYLTTFSRLPELINLDLSSNHMQVIPRKSLEILDNLKVVELRNNRWKCGCGVREVMQWASSLRAHASLQRPIKCFEKGHYRTLWSYAKGEEPCQDMFDREYVIEVVGDDGKVWYEGHVESYSQPSFLLPVMILFCVLSISVLLTSFALSCMDRCHIADKLPRYKHIDG